MFLQIYKNIIFVKTLYMGNFQQKNIFTSGMNLDDDVRYLKDGEYVEAWNFLINDKINKSSGLGKNYRGIKPIILGISPYSYQGHTYQPSAWNTSTNYIYAKDKAIGWAKDKKGNAIYFFVCETEASIAPPSWGSIEYYKPRIFRLDVITNEIKLIYDRINLNFKPQNYIQAKFFNDNLYWCDGVNYDSNQVRHINLRISCQLPEISGGYESDIDISAAKPTIKKNVYWLLAHDTSYVGDNKIEGKVFQFAARYIYAGGEKSVWSMLSTPCVVYPKEQTNQERNMILLAVNNFGNYGGGNDGFESYSKIISFIEYAFKEGTYNHWKLIGRYKYTPNITTQINYPDTYYNTISVDGVNCTNIISFYNDEAYTIIPDQEILNPFDTIPQKSKAIEITESRLHLANNIEDFPTLTNVEYNSSQYDKQLGYDQEVTEVNDFLSTSVTVGTQTAMINSKTFKPNSSYKIGIAFEDYVRRKTFVYTSKNLTFKTDEQYGELEHTNTIRLPTFNGSLLPQWVKKLFKHYVILCTENTDVSWFIQSAVEHVYYVSSKDINNNPVFTKKIGGDYNLYDTPSADYKKTYEDENAYRLNYVYQDKFNYVLFHNSVADRDLATEIWFDISNFTKYNNTPYIWNDGDMLRVLTTGGEISRNINKKFERKIINQTGRFLVIKQDPLPYSLDLDGYDYDDNDKVVISISSDNKIWASVLPPLPEQYYFGYSRMIFESTEKLMKVAIEKYTRVNQSIWVVLAEGNVIHCGLKTDLETISPVVATHTLTTIADPITAISCPSYDSSAPGTRWHIFYAVTSTGKHYILHFNPSSLTTPPTVIDISSGSYTNKTEGFYLVDCNVEYVLGIYAVGRKIVFTATGYIGSQSIVSCIVRENDSSFTHYLPMEVKMAEGVRFTSLATQCITATSISINSVIVVLGGVRDGEIGEIGACYFLLQEDDPPGFLYYPKGIYFIDRRNDPKFNPITGVTKMFGNLQNGTEWHKGVVFLFCTSKGELYSRGFFQEDDTFFNNPDDFNVYESPHEESPQNAEDPARILLNYNFNEKDYDVGHVSEQSDNPIYSFNGKPHSIIPSNNNFTNLVILNRCEDQFASIPFEVFKNNLIMFSGSFYGLAVHFGANVGHNISFNPYDTTRYPLIGVETFPVLNYGALIEIYRPKLNISEIYYESMLGTSKKYSTYEVSSKPRIYTIDSNLTTNNEHEINYNRTITEGTTGDEGDVFVLEKTFTGRYYTKKYKIVSMTPDVRNTTGEYISGSDKLISNGWQKALGKINIKSKYEENISFKKTGHRFSNIALPFGKVNGMCTFEASDERIFPQEYNQINVLIVASDNKINGVVMLSFFDNEVISIYIGRTQLEQVGIDRDLLVSDKVLGSFNTLDGGYGCIHPSSVAEYNQRVYWWDGNKGVICRYGRDGITPISDLYKVKSWAMSKAKEYSSIYHSPDLSKEYSQLAIGHFDEYNGHYVLILRDQDKNGYAIVFDEELNRFVTFLELWLPVNKKTPDLLVGLNNKMYSIANVNSITLAIYEHNTGVNGSMYDECRATSVKVPINKFPSDVKILKNIKIEGLDIWQVKEVRTNLNNRSNPQISKIFVTDFSELEGFYCADFNKDINTVRLMTSHSQSGLTPYLRTTAGSKIVLGFNSINFYNIFSEGYSIYYNNTYIGTVNRIDSSTQMTLENEATLSIPIVATVYYPTKLSISDEAETLKNGDELIGTHGTITLETTLNCKETTIFAVDIEFNISKPVNTK